MARVLRLSKERLFNLSSLRLIKYQKYNFSRIIINNCTDEQIQVDVQPLDKEFLWGCYEPMVPARKSNEYRNRKPGTCTFTYSWCK